MEQKKAFHYRSLFWPVVFIGVGLLWLLANLNLIPREGWLTLLRFWPVFLIAIGVDIMIGRQSRLIGGAIGLSVVVLALVLVFVGPEMGFAPVSSAKTDVVSEPLGSAESAHIDIDLSVGEATITALEDSTNLLEADIHHLGELEFTVSGEQEKNIRLREKEQHLSINWFDIFEDQNLRWDIGLSPDIPMDIIIDGGVGESDLDLSQLIITKLDLDSGVGDMTITLPATGSSYEVNVDVGVGRVELRLEDDIDVTIDIDGGVGDTIIVVPENVGVRLVGEIGVGDIHVPGSYRLIKTDEDRIVGESGVWESSNYDDAAHIATITFDSGVGNFTIR
jgi:hypothetical protein